MGRYCGLADNGETPPFGAAVRDLPSGQWFRRNEGAAIGVRVDEGAVLFYCHPTVTPSFVDDGAFMDETVTPIPPPTLPEGV